MEVGNKNGEKEKTEMEGDLRGEGGEEKMDDKF
jgi:hypothetical protein